MPDIPSTQIWQKVTSLDEIPVLGARVIQAHVGQIAIFRNSENEIFAVLESTYFL